MGVSRLAPADPLSFQGVRVLFVSEISRASRPVSYTRRSVGRCPLESRSALGREGAKAAARKRGATRGTGSGAGAMTVAELRREAARLRIAGRSKMGKAQLIRAVGQRRRSA